MSLRFNRGPFGGHHISGGFSTPPTTLSPLKTRWISGLLVRRNGRFHKPATGLFSLIGTGRPQRAGCSLAPPGLVLAAGLGEVCRMLVPGLEDLWTADGAILGCCESFP